jgi:hypothetical protein
MKQMIEVNKERFWNTLHHQNVFTRITGEYPYVTEFRRSDRLLVGNSTTLSTATGNPANRGRSSSMNWVSITNMPVSINLG